MIALKMWLCVSILITLLVYGLGYIIIGIVSTTDISASNNDKENAFHLKAAIHRLVRGVAATVAAIAALVTWARDPEILGWNILFICGLSVVVTAAAFRFGPKAPDKSDIYTKGEFDKKLHKSQKDEIQTLLVRLKDLQAKSASNDSYREVHAIDELQVYLIERLSNMSNISSY